MNRGRGSSRGSSERTDGDTTSWSYDPASGLELSKTYADGSSVTKSYDSFGRLATETNARGIVKTFSYFSTTGELAGIVYSDNSTPAQSFTYTLTGKLASVTDAAGTRSFTYNEYDELVSDSLTADGVTHLIAENRDGFGRAVGFACSKNGNAACSEQYGYGTDGRLNSAAFSHGGERKTFHYSYPPGSKLLLVLNSMTCCTLPNSTENTHLRTGWGTLCWGICHEMLAYFTWMLTIRWRGSRGAVRAGSFARC